MQLNEFSSTRDSEFSFNVADLSLDVLRNMQLAYHPQIVSEKPTEYYSPDSSGRFPDLSKTQLSGASFKFREKTPMGKLLHKWKMKIFKRFSNFQGIN